MTEVLRKYVVGFLLAILMFPFFTSTVMAGFGITPPYVSNSSLTRNTIYEQEILMVRSDPSVALDAQVSVVAPGFEDWIQIVEGTTIPLPVGEQKVPMTVRVTVPPDADFADYDGSIKIRTESADGDITQGAVSITLGAIVDIRLTVIDRVIEDFRVRKISVSDLNEGVKVGWLFFPGKILFDILMENTGNVPIAPSRVEFKIFDRTGQVLLEDTQNIGRIRDIEPYDTETVTAELPTRLPAGSYIARYQIFNNDTLKQEGDLSLSILPAGSVQAAGFGFVGLSAAHKVSILLPIFAVIIAVLYILFMRRRKAN